MERIFTGVSVQRFHTRVKDGPCPHTYGTYGKMWYLMSQHELGQVTGGDAEEHSFSLSEHIWTVKEAGVGVERRRWESKGSLRPSAPSGVLQVHYSALHSFFYFNTCVRGRSGSKKKLKKKLKYFWADNENKRWRSHFFLFQINHLLHFKRRQ